MNKFLVAVLGALLVVTVGCQDKGKSGDPKMLSTDACSHCPGVQKAKADGTCPMCGEPATNAKMLSADACPVCEGVQTASPDGKCAQCEAKKAGGGAASSAIPAAGTADACSHCPGVQVATAAGKCPVCKADIAK